eukprot:ANDGO_02930.mRNA.1 hypothetical protein ACA1_089300
MEGGSSEEQQPSILQHVAQVIPLLNYHILHPHQFFISYSSVFVLAFTGFPASVIRFKEVIEAFDAFRPENPGSKWPKCTLGYLTPGHTLTEEEFVAIQEFANQFANRSFGPQCIVRDLSIVKLKHRTLENPWAMLTVPLTPLTLGGGIETALPTDEEIEHTNAVLAESLQSKAAMRTYFEKRIRDKTDRDAVYYAADAIPMDKENTMVHFLHSGDTGLLDYIENFKAELCSAVPAVRQKYMWAPRESLHITYRALNAKDQ